MHRSDGKHSAHSHNVRDAELVLLRGHNHRRPLLRRHLLHDAPRLLHVEDGDPVGRAVMRRGPVRGLARERDGSSETRCVFDAPRGALELRRENQQRNVRLTAAQRGA